MTIYINRLLKISIALISLIHEFNSEIIQTYLKEKEVFFNTIGYFRPSYFVFWATPC